MAATVGLALVVKDEEANLPRLLTSVEGAFDRVVLLDTGSTDHTVEIFQHWAKEQPGLTFSVGTFEWVDDFGLARQAADALLRFGSIDAIDRLGEDGGMVDWCSWADADDVIENPGQLRVIADGADPAVGVFIFGYDYGRDPQGRCICHLRRERLVRAGHGAWMGRVHEAQGFPRGSQVIGVPDSVCRWVHRKFDTPDAEPPSSNERNLRILEKWAVDEPHDSRVVGYLGTELFGAQRLEEAIVAFRAYQALEPGWTDERAQIYRKLSLALALSGDTAGAKMTAYAAMDLQPSWPDTYLTLAEIAATEGQWEKAHRWATQALDIGQPETLLILNPLDYTYRPRFLIALTLAETGDFDGAITMAEEAFQFGAEDDLRYRYMGWRSLAKREHTAKTVIMSAQQLVAHDEQLKALTLLEECVPAFAMDHPDVVACRHWVRERLQWALSPESVADFYNDASRPEDFISDEDVPRLGEALPRIQFLVEGVREQAAA